MDEDKFIRYAKDAIVLYCHSVLKTEIKPSNICSFWHNYNKTAQNSKALLYITIPNTRYFEVTYDSNKKELSLDSYTKEFNKVIKL